MRPQESDDGALQRRKRTPKTRKFRELMCSPSASKTRATRGTCYPNKTLQRIKAEYNRTHPAESIRASDPASVHAELRERLLSQCSSEECWMSQLPKKESAYLKKHIFAPKHPASWNKNPTEWLSNFDIMDVLDQYEDAYPEFAMIGPSPMDFDTQSTQHQGGCVWEDLCKFSLTEMMAAKKRKIGIVFNMDDHDEPGSHWVSMFIDIDARAIFYFDSAGGDTPPEITAFTKRVQEQGTKLNPPLPLSYRENGAHTHQKSNTECGMYSLFFNVVMLTGQRDGADMSYPARVRLFTKGNVSDRQMQNFRSIYFNRPASEQSE